MMTIGRFIGELYFFLLGVLISVGPIAAILFVAYSIFF